MSCMTCSDVVPMLEEWLHEELAAPDSAACAAHLRACVPCGTALERAQQLDGMLAPLRSDSAWADAAGATGIAWRLQTVRDGALAAAEKDLATRRTRSAWMARLSLAAAAALTVVVAMGLRSRPVTEPTAAAPVAAASVPQGAPAAEDDVQLVTLVTSEGVALRWAGKDESYLVLKSRRPSSFTDAERTLVCGNSFTDRSVAQGVVYYRVVPAPERCRA